MDKLGEITRKIGELSEDKSVQDRIVIAQCVLGFLAFLPFVLSWFRKCRCCIKSTRRWLREQKGKKLARTPYRNPDPDARTTTKIDKWRTYEMATTEMISQVGDLSFFWLREFLSAPNSNSFGCAEGQPDDSLFLKATLDYLKGGLVFDYRNGNEIMVGGHRFFIYKTTGRRVIAFFKSRPSQQKLQAFEEIANRLEANVAKGKPVDFIALRELLSNQVLRQ